MKALDEKFVRRAVIKWLSRQGYDRHLREKETSEHGVDISVRHNKYVRYFFVEIKGDANPRSYKFPESGKEVNFVYALGQILSRMKGKARNKYAVGFPQSYRSKVLKRLPWIVCKKLNLNVLLVSENGKVENIDWKTLRKAQKLI